MKKIFDFTFVLSFVLAIKENKHPFEISKMLGHTSIKTTFDVYGHLL